MFTRATRTRPRGAPWTLGALCLALLLAGCGGATGPTGAGGTPGGTPAAGATPGAGTPTAASSLTAVGTGDPCAIVTPAMLQQAVGMSFAAPTTKSAPGGPSIVQSIECDYRASGATVAFLYARYDSSADAMKDYAASRHTGDTDAAGVGDAAFYDLQTDSIWVLKGTVFFTLAVAEGGRQQPGPERQLAVAIVAKL